MIALNTSQDAQVISVVPGPPRSFQALLTLSFAIGSPDESIVIDAENSVVSARFVALDYNAVSPPASALRATVAAADPFLVAVLDAPRQLRGIATGGEVAARGKASADRTMVRNGPETLQFPRNRAVPKWPK